MPAEKFNHDKDMMTEDFDSDSNTSLDIACNVVSVLPREYDQVMEVEEPKDVAEMEMTRHKPVYYYIMNNGYVEEQNTFFERLDESMKSHLKPLFIKGKIENVGVNKILVDGGATINLMLHYMLKRFGKDDTDTRPHNMVLSNCEGKVRIIIGVIQIDLIVDTITRSTMFMVITSNANYNMLLGREWIHGIFVVPFSMHQRITIWRSDGIVENIEADQIYLMAEVNHADKSNFEKNLTHIAPCNSAGSDFSPTGNIFCSLYLHPTHGCQWDR